MKRLMLAVSAVLLVSANALAQDAGQIGLTLGYPTAVGVIWHVTDNVAVRPEISFATGSTESPVFSSVSLSDLTASIGEASSTTVTAGVSGLFYFGQWDKLRAYLSPRYTYSRLTGSSGSTFVSDTRNSAFTVTGSFGAQYQLHRRFAVFGETGFGYTHTHSSFTSTLRLSVIPVGINVSPVTQSEETNSHNWGIRTAAGVIFYFK
jgi:hypothetical protein